MLQGVQYDALISHSSFMTAADSSTGPDFRAVFDAAPTPLLLLSSSFVIIAVNDAYLRATRRSREELVGVFLFDAFPDNPEQPGADGVAKLKASLQSVLETRAGDTMAIQRYDIPIPPDKHFEERYWSPVNTPVLDGTGSVVQIIHRVEDVTDFVRTRARAEVSEAKVTQQTLEVEAANDRLRHSEERALELLREGNEQRAQIDAVLEAAPVGIFVVDAEARLLRMNPENERLWGWDRLKLGEPITFDRWKAVWAGDSPLEGQPVEASDWPLAAALRGERVSPVLMRVQAREGGANWHTAIASAAPIQDASGALLGAVAAVMDITDRVEAKSALREAEHRYRQLFELMTEEVHFWRLVRDDSGAIQTWRLLDANRPALATWDRSLDEIRDRTADEIFGAGTTEHYRHIVERVMREGQPLTYPDYFPALNRHFRFTTIPLGDQFITIGTDVTAARNAQETITRQNDALREADARKDRFLATLSHELRNPLAPIRTAAELLGRPGVSPEQLSAARGVIQRQVGQMALLLDDLLEVARITQGKLELRRQETGLDRIIENAVEAARPIVERKQHQLDLELPTELPVVDADPLRLAQVLSNLLTNAAKYTPPNGRIALRVEVQGDTLRIEVRDNGIGIAPEALPTLFTMFSQVQEGLQHAEGGLGIGLALVRGLVELHGGAVSASSEGPGRGSSFIVTLPVVRGGSQADASVPSAATSSRRKVLVADDNRDSADTLAMLLSSLGHDVRVAYNGRGAVAQAKVFRPDVALIDIGMPEIDGNEVARLLRNERWSTGLVLVAVTGWGQAEDRARAHEAGFDEHLTKPVGPARLESVLAGARRTGRL